MSAFASEVDNENFLNESNIPAAFCSPKGSEKDFSLILPNSSDRSFKMNTPIGGTLFQDTSLVLHDDTNNSLNEAVLNDSETSEPAATEEGETLAQRLEREERESQELAWQLMQQDNMEMYNLQLQYMQQNASDLNDEDFQLMQALVNEAGQQVVQPLPVPAQAADGDDEEEGEGEDLNESDASNWDYERLLQLGQQLGDVKTERWRMRAKAVISSLPRKLYSTILAERGVHVTAAPAAAASATEKAAVETVFSLPCASPVTVLKEDEKDREASSSNKKQCVRKEECGCPAVTVAAPCESERCVVCMDDYQAEEELALLPCKHYFHVPCTEGWLADHNFCPSCKTQVSATPTK